MAITQKFDITIDQTTPEEFAIWLQFTAVYKIPLTTQIDDREYCVFALLKQPSNRQPYYSVEIVRQPAQIVYDGARELLKKGKPKVGQELPLDEANDITFEAVRIIPLGGGIRAIGYSTGLEKQWEGIDKWIKNTYGDRAHINPFLERGKTSTQVEIKQRKDNKQLGRYPLTDQEIEERMRIVRDANKMKKENHSWKTHKIADKLNISVRTLRYWRHYTKHVIQR